MGTCSNSCTICPEVYVTTCFDTVSLAKHDITNNALQILLNGLYKNYNNTILINTLINDKEEKTRMIGIHTLNV